MGSNYLGDFFSAFEVGDRVGLGLGALTVGGLWVWRFGWPTIAVGTIVQVVGGTFVLGAVGLWYWWRNGDLLRMRRRFDHIVQSLGLGVAAPDRKSAAFPTLGRAWRYEYGVSFLVKSPPGLPVEAYELKRLIIEHAVGDAVSFEARKGRIYMTVTTGLPDRIDAPEVERNVV